MRQPARLPTPARPGRGARGPAPARTAGWRTTIDYRENHVRSRDGQLLEVEPVWTAEAERFDGQLSMASAVAATAEAAWRYLRDEIDAHHIITTRPTIRLLRRGRWSACGRPASLARMAHSFFRAGVVIVVRHPDGERILAFERADSPGSWQLPQGGLHRGESPIEGAWRELGEETGLGRGRRGRPRRVPGVDRLRVARRRQGAARPGRQAPRTGPPLVPVRRPVDADVAAAPDGREFRRLAVGVGPTS